MPQLVATDLLAPHLHHDERCKDEGSRKKHGEIECVAMSLIKHISKKHGIDTDTINKKMDAYGMGLADILTSQLKHMSKKEEKGDAAFGPGKQNNPAYRSNPAAAEAASAERRASKAARRRKLGAGGAASPRPTRRRAGPRDERPSELCTRTLGRRRRRRQAVPRKGLS